MSGKGYYQPKTPYHDFCKATFLLEGLANHKGWPLFIGVGPESHFVYRAGKKFKEETQKAGWRATLLDIDDVNPEVLRAAVQGGGFFEAVRPLILLRAEKRPSVMDEIQMLAKSDGMFSAPIFIAWNGEKLPVKLQNKLDAVKQQQIPCLTPQAAEWNSVVGDFAYEVGIKFRPDGVKALLDAVGFDARVLENEIRALGLIFHDKTQELGEADVRNYVGMLREDHAFGLDDHLREGRQGKAALLIDSLMDRGESSLAMLGLLARHLRNGVKASEVAKRRGTAPQLATELRIPQGVARSLLTYAAKKGEGAFGEGLIQAAAVDRMLKSSKVDDALALNQVIDALK